MPRRIVIGIIILIIIAVLGGIAVLVVRQLNAPSNDLTQQPQTTALPLGGTRAEDFLDPTLDSDNDGLTNADEIIWKTNPFNSDTDGDGYLDGEEVLKNHNPTIASPNDKLPVGFQPGANISPLDNVPLQTTSQSIFSNDVDVTGGNINLTEEYARTVPDRDKTPLTLTQFVQAQPITTTLPALKESSILPEQDVPLALAQYISIAGDVETITDKTLLARAISELLNEQDASRFETLAARVRSFQSELQTTRVPATAIEYHKLISGYTELLAASFSQIANFDNDNVKALVALRQVDAIDRQYFPLIIRERSRLIDLSQ